MFIPEGFKPAKLEGACRTNEPPLIVIAPEEVAPVIVSVPLPFLVSDPAPLIVPEYVVLEDEFVVRVDPVPITRAPDPAILPIVMLLPIDKVPAFTVVLPV